MEIFWTLLICGAILIFAVTLLVRKGRQLSISAADLQSFLADKRNVFLIDVRSREEFESGHIPGAVCMPHMQIGSGLNDIPRSDAAAVVVYCERGPRAYAALNTLHKAGITGALHLSGDMSGWRSAGLPVER